jgi:hypothetical protein
MIALPSGVRVWLACGHTDMRKGMDGLAMLAQQVLNEDPFSGALFAFRGNAMVWSNCFGLMGKDCAYSASGWRGAIFCGQRPTLAASR